jgi:molecular chaperone HtpG
MSTETYAFQAEINQLLSLIINAFYSNKDVFLRELISNASDAIDKIRYQSLTNSEILGSDHELMIRIVPDVANKTLTIEDNGIGMNKDALIKNLGTIAHSGTRAFVEAIQSGQQADVNLIGQFGVGFYSAYLVADKVTVVSKPAGEDEDTHIWESSASGSFTVRKATEEDPKIDSRGTKIILHLKEDQQEYLTENKIKTIVQTHNGYCSFPIMCWVEREETVEEDVSSVDQDEEGKVEDAKDDAAEPKPKKTVKKQLFEKLNKQQPIWMRKPEDVTQ